MFYTNTFMFISANVTKEYNPNFLNVTSLYIRNKIEKEIFIPEKTSPRGKRGETERLLQTGSCEGCFKRQKQKKLSRSREKGVDIADS